MAMVVWVGDRGFEQLFCQKCFCAIHLITPANEVWGKAIFSEAYASHSVHGVTMIFTSCLVSFSLHGFSVPGHMFLLRCLCPGGLCMGVSVQGVSVQGGSVWESLSEGLCLGGLCLEVSAWGFLSRGSAVPGFCRESPESEKWVVCFLLECFLVSWKIWKKSYSWI